MAIRDIFKISRKTFVNPLGWFGYESVKDQNRTIWEILKAVFTPARPEREETFEEAMKRLNLTENDVQNAITYYRYYAFGFLMLAFLALLYSLYLLLEHDTYTGFILGVAVMVMFGCQAFKYDFWALQMRRRTLGLTYADWKKSLFSKKDA